MLEGQHGSAAAVAAADVNGIVLYCVGSIGILKILSMESGTQVSSCAGTFHPSLHMMSHCELMHTLHSSGRKRSRM